MNKFSLVTSFLVTTTCMLHGFSANAMIEEVGYPPSRTTSNKFKKNVIDTYRLSTQKEWRAYSINGKRQKSKRQLFTTPDTKDSFFHAISIADEGFISQERAVNALLCAGNDPFIRDMVAQEIYVAYRKGRYGSRKLQNDYSRFGWQDPQYFFSHQSVYTDYVNKIVAHPDYFAPDSLQNMQRLSFLKAVATIFYKDLIVWEISKDGGRLETAYQYTHPNAKGAWEVLYQDSHFSGVVSVNREKAIQTALGHEKLYIEEMLHAYVEEGSCREEDVFKRSYPYPTNKFFNTVQQKHLAAKERKQKILVKNPELSAYDFTINYQDDDSKVKDYLESRRSSRHAYLNPDYWGADPFFSGQIPDVNEEYPRKIKSHDWDEMTQNLKSLLQGQGQKEFNLRYLKELKGHLRNSLSNKFSQNMKKRIFRLWSCLSRQSEEEGTERKIAEQNAFYTIARGIALQAAGHCPDAVRTTIEDMEKGLFCNIATTLQDEVAQVIHRTTKAYFLNFAGLLDNEKRFVRDEWSTCAPILAEACSFSWITGVQPLTEFYLVPDEITRYGHLFGPRFLLKTFLKGGSLTAKSTRYTHAQEAFTPETLIDLTREAIEDFPLAYDITVDFMKFVDPENLFRTGQIFNELEYCDLRACHQLR